MTTECSRFRDQIPKAMLGDIGAGEADALASHLAQCGPCRAEQDLYSATFSHLKAASDVSVPRHFFVYEEKGAGNPWQLFRHLRFAWQGALVTALVAVAFLGVAASTRLQIRAGDGALTIGFGPLSSPGEIPAKPTVDTAALEATILNAVKEKTRQDGLELLKTVRAEIAQSNGALGRQQRKQLELALSRVETRMGTNLSLAMNDVQARNDRSMAEMYQAISAQHQRDLNALGTRIDRLAVNGAIKSNQTDAILETLLQVAELRMTK